MKAQESQEEQLLDAIQALKLELRDLLGPEEGARLNRQLGQYLRWARSPQHRERAITRALAAIGEHPPARERLAAILRQEGREEIAGRLFQPLPGEPVPPSSYSPLLGEPVPLPPGTLMVCPVDPTHYRRWLQFAGQRLWCPEHNVELVPERKPQ